MIITPEINQRNKRFSITLGAIFTFLPLVCGFFFWPLWLFVPLGGFLYWFTRRRCVRRMRVMAEPFDPYLAGLLKSHVAYYNTLDEKEKERFHQLVKIFLDETRITGVGTDVDDLTRVLVAASAVIPIFGFPYFDYDRLGEVLIYPGTFNEKYRSDGGEGQGILGMVGTGHLSGVMILSKPDLISGFANPEDKRNVGIHEFAHLVDGADGAIDGLPPGVTAEVVMPWIEWVGRELAGPPKGRSHINKYAYTNEVEYFAVLTEYFFESPEVLERKNPEMYAMLQKMFRQDTKSFLTGAALRLPKRVGRNRPCPCGSGEKYKRCCLRRTARK